MLLPIQEAGGERRVSDMLSPFLNIRVERGKGDLQGVEHRM